MNNVAYLFGAAPVMPIAATPTVGYYYQVVKGDTPWKVSKIAYQDKGLATVKTGLFLLNDNPANSHIQKATTGWESYNVKGLQFNPKYAAGDATAATGSGTAYPLVWVPPLDGKTPDDMIGGGGTGPAGPAGSQGRTGEKGEKGDKGDKGDPGTPGHTPTTAEIKALISDFMEENPVSGQVSAADLAKAVENYLKANPVAQGARGPQGLPGKDGLPGHTPTNAEIKALISDFMEENPVAGQVSAADLAKAVENYLKANPITQGARGPQGLPGATGAPGRAPTAAEIANAVSTYMQANPVSSGGAGFDLDQARDFVDARIRVALRNFKPDVQEASVNWLGVFAAGIAAAALLTSMKSMKRVKGLKSLTGGSVVRVQ